jgi:hypothetical protein
MAAASSGSDESFLEWFDGKGGKRSSVTLQHADGMGRGTGP